MTRLRPLPRVCGVCEGACSLQLVSVFDIPTAPVRTWCPGCVGVAGEPVPIPDLTYREDLPRGAA